MIEEKIMAIMSTIEYGVDKPDNADFKTYHLLEPTELLTIKCGICWDQVELERYLFEQEHIATTTYYICMYNDDDDYLPTHTFLTYQKNNKCYWFEHAWEKYQGIHEYNTLKELLLDVKTKFILDNNGQENNSLTFVYEYQKPPKHLSYQEFYDYMETQKLIKLNKPLYFYYLINKNSSLQEILNSQKQYKFLKYPPYKELGPNISNLLKEKDIYRININDEQLIKNMKDIDYSELTREYYEQVTKEEYFKNYDDNLEIYNSLNYITIEFINNNYLLEFFEKLDN